MVIWQVLIFGGRGYWAGQYFLDVVIWQDPISSGNGYLAGPHKKIEEYFKNNFMLEWGKLPWGEGHIE